jgi:hypothetical protein
MPAHSRHDSRNFISWQWFILFDAFGYNLVCPLADIFRPSNPLWHTYSLAEAEPKRKGAEIESSHYPVLGYFHFWRCIEK